MRRHTLGPESIRKQIISVFTTSSRKRQNLTNNNSTNNSTLNVDRPSRRFSVPDKKYLDVCDNNHELHTIDEVSELIFI
jgi:hypothetical protein